MIPNIVDGVEVPIVADLLGIDAFLYAMTPEEAAVEREIIDNVSMIKGEDQEAIWLIFTEVTPPFFHGTQSAADTARILQNRIQRVLDERG